MEGDKPPWRQKICRGGENVLKGQTAETKITMTVARIKKSSHLSVNQCSERQVVKQVCKVLPDVGIAVLPQALVIEAVDLRDLPRLVVPSQDGDSLLETNLSGKRKHWQIRKPEKNECIDKYFIVSWVLFYSGALKSITNITNFKKFSITEECIVFRSKRH